jgi:hypothetical protein
VPHLLFITDRFPPDLGGLASSADRITKVLCQLGVEVDVLTWSRSLQPGEVFLPEPSVEKRLKNLTFIESGAIVIGI